MGMSVNGGGFGSRRRGSGATLSEINVTPFVDVVLVLLVIFMLTAHVMEFGLQVEVPETKYVSETTQELPVLTVDKTGDSTLNGVKVNINDLVHEVHTRFPAAKGVYVQADKQTVWDPIAQVLAELGQGKFVVNMVYKPVDTAKRR
jgi:biopolymer transport protein ExbD